MADRSAHETVFTPVASANIFQHKQAYIERDFVLMPIFLGVVDVAKKNEGITFRRKISSLLSGTLPIATWFPCVDSPCPVLGAKAAMGHVLAGLSSPER